MRPLPCPSRRGCDGGPTRTCLCRTLPADMGLRDQDPAKLRFYSGSLFVNVHGEMRGMERADVESLWERWIGQPGSPHPSKGG